MENENNRFGNQNIGSNQTPSTDNASSCSYGTDSTNNTSSNFYATPVPSGEPPKKKKWPIFAAVGGAVVVAGGAAATYFFLFRTPSFQTPTEAITTCISQLGEQFSPKELELNTLDDKLDSEALLSAMNENGTQMELALTFENSSVNELSMIEGANLGFTYSNDIKSNQTTANFSASFLGVGGDIGFYNDKDIIALTSKEFLQDANLTLNKKDFLETLKGSMDEEELDALTAMFEQQSAQMASGLTDFTDYALKQLPDSMVSFAKEWDIKENSKKDSIKIAKEDYDCFTYEISITGEAFQRFVDDYCSYLAEYNFDENGFFTLLQESVNDMGEDVNISDTIKEGLNSLADEIDTSSDDTLDFIMYVSPKGKMLGADFDLTNSRDDVIKLELRFGGDKPGQDIYMNLREDIDGTSMDYDLACKRAVDSDVETVSYEIAMDIDGQEVLTMDADSSYNTDDDTVKSSLTATISDGSDTASLTFDLDGKYEEIKKGTGYELSFDKLLLSIDSDDLSGSVEFSGSISLNVCDGSIKKPSGTSYNMLSMNDQDLESLLKTLKKSSTLSMVLGNITVEDLKELFQSTLGDIENGLSTYGDQNLTGLLGEQELDDLFRDDKLPDSPNNDNDTPDSSEEVNNTPDAADAPEDTSSLDDKWAAYLSSEDVTSTLETFNSQLNGTGMSIDITGEGNVLTYTYTYDNLAKQDGMEEEISSALDAQDSTYKLTAKYIGKDIGIDNLIIRVRYIDKNGAVICEKDYTAD